MKRVNTKKIAQFDFTVLKRAPYRGIQKEVADELGMSTVAVHRAIAKREINVMTRVLKKMVEINRTMKTISNIESQLRVHFNKAADGALEIDMNVEPDRGHWQVARKKRRASKR